MAYIRTTDLINQTISTMIQDTWDNTVLGAQVVGEVATEIAADTVLGAQIVAETPIYAAEIVGDIVIDGATDIAVATIDGAATVIQWGSDAANTLIEVGDQMLDTLDGWSETIIDVSEKIQSGEINAQTVTTAVADGVETLVTTGATALSNWTASQIQNAVTAILDQIQYYEQDSHSSFTVLYMDFLIIAAYLETIQAVQTQVAQSIVAIEQAQATLASSWKGAAADQAQETLQEILTGLQTDQSNLEITYNFVATAKMVYLQLAEQTNESLRAVQTYLQT